MGAWTSRMESNLPKVLDAIVRQGRSIKPYMITVRVGGSRRSPSDNARIMAIQRTLGRDPWYLTSEESRSLGAITRSALSSPDPGAELARLAPDIGRAMVRYFRDHIDMHRARKGAMPPNAPSVVRRKGGKPPLRDSDELYNSLTFEARVIS